MASNLLKHNINPTTIVPSKPQHSTSSSSLSLSLSFPKHHHSNHHLHHHYNNQNSRICHSSIQSSTSSSLSSTPPNSKEEAILQAKKCLSEALEKPLNNPKFAGKFKKLKQPRFQIEIPVMDDTPNSLTQLAFEVFQNFPIKKKDTHVKTIMLWPNLDMKQDAFESHSSNKIEIQHMGISSVDYKTLNSADFAVFIAPNTSDLRVMKNISDSLYPKPLVMFNPNWGFEEDPEFGDFSGFVKSFEVIYSFMGLQVKGVFSTRKGMVFKCVRDGVLSGDKWVVLVEEQGGEMRVVSSFPARPSAGEVENVLYNLMAVNSPITKSVKFFKNLVSNVTGKK